MNDKIIHDYLQGNISPEKEKALWEWINLSDENETLFFKLKALWNAQQTAFRNDKRFMMSLKELNKKINAHENHKRNKKRQMFQIWSSITAIALIAVIFYFSFPQLINKKADLIVYTNSSDTVRIITLTDGTKVWLRNNTTLTCSSLFGNETREVSLEGEAFFDVTKHTCPFIVKADANLIKVIGTSFSINTNQGGFIETILMSGTIQLQQTGENGVMILHPGQQALYSKEHKSLEINEIDPNIYTSWRYDLTSLSHVSVHTILQCIEDSYRVKLKMDTTSLKGRYYNFSFKHSKSIYDALNQLSLITGVPIEIIN